MGSSANGGVTDNSPEEANQEDEGGIEIVHVADNVDDEESLSRIELENQLKRLFSQSRKNEPKKDAVLRPS